jgi:hypothetical protein
MDKTLNETTAPVFEAQPQWMTFNCQTHRHTQDPAVGYLVARNGHTDDKSLRRTKLLFIGYASPGVITPQKVASWLRQLGYWPTHVHVDLGPYFIPHWPGHYYQFDAEGLFLTHVSGAPISHVNDEPVTDYQPEVDRSQVARLISLIQAP